MQTASEGSDFEPTVQLWGLVGTGIRGGAGEAGSGRSGSGLGEGGCGIVLLVGSRPAQMEM